MGLETPENKINNFIKIPSHIKKQFQILGVNLYDEKYEKIENKFRTQFPEIDEKSYILLERENKKIGKNYTEVFKKETELNELINYSFFKAILNNIQKEKSEIQTTKIYNTYGYTDRKTGVDYTIFLKLKDGINIAFGIDLKNGRNAEENFHDIIPGIFTLITQNTKGEILSHDKIKKNIEISKVFFSHASKHKRKYEIGINHRNQDEINRIVSHELLTTRLDSELKKLNIFDYIKEILTKIIDSEIEASEKNIIGVINDTKGIADTLLDKAQAAKLAEIQKEKKKQEQEKQAKRKKREKERKLEDQKRQEQEQEKQTKTKEKYETGKNYTLTKYREDLLFLSDMNNKTNITQNLKRIAKKIKSNKKLKENFNNFYQKSIEENSFKFELKKDTYKLIENPKKTFLNRFKKLYDLVNQN